MKFRDITSCELGVHVEGPSLVGEATVLADGDALLADLDRREADDVVEVLVPSGGDECVEQPRTDHAFGDHGEARPHELACGGRSPAPVR